MNSSDNKKDDVSKSKLARFGNKKVIKYSDEYHHQRLKNNESVKNSRFKAKQKQKETEGKMNKLAEENRTLNERVDSLMKELQVLRSLYKELGQDLPVDAVKALEQINIY
jgi:predicted nuclease with TOPRIM domain